MRDVTGIRYNQIDFIHMLKKAPKNYFFTTIYKSIPVNHTEKILYINWTSFRNKRSFRNTCCFSAPKHHHCPYHKNCMRDFPLQLTCCFV